MTDLNKPGLEYNAALIELRLQIMACSNNAERFKILSNSKITLPTSDCIQLFKYDIKFFSSNLFVFSLCISFGLPKFNSQLTVWKEKNMKTPEWNWDVFRIVMIKKLEARNVLFIDLLSFPNAQLKKNFDFYLAKSGI